MSDFNQSGVETFQRCFPQNPGKFCTLINTNDQQLVKLVNDKLQKNLKVLDMDSLEVMTR